MGIKSHIVIGLGFGDEGKGITTDYLTSQSSNPLVLRTTGGQQAGHTVIIGEKRHVFASVGSGTMRGAPTYWTKYCTFAPHNLLIELDYLKKLGINPVIFVDSLCPVTTIYDQLANRIDTYNVEHGTCGMGVGKTLDRHESPIKLFVGDLRYPIILKQKLRLISTYYLGNTINEQELEDFMWACEEVLEHINIVNEVSFDWDFSDYIFEGSQGILLDKEFGFFPHVTRSSTTSQNAIDFIQRNNLPKPEVYYITRAYQTRHGNGPMTNEGIPLRVENNPIETNVTGGYQGEFRKTILDLDLLNYALSCDKNFAGPYRKHLVITCSDQVREGLTYTSKGEVIKGDFYDVQRRLNTVFDKIYYTMSHSSDSMKILERN